MTFSYRDPWQCHLCVYNVYIYMLLEWKRREYSKNKQGDFLRKITLNGVNLLNKTPQKGVFFP